VRYIDLHAIWIPGIGCTVAALFGLVSGYRVKGCGSEGQIVVHELSPGDDENSGGMVMVAFVRVNSS